MYWLHKLYFVDCFLKLIMYVFDYVDVEISFDNETYTVLEDKGPVCFTLVLKKPTPFDFVINIRDIGHTATGELCTIFCIHILHSMKNDCR